MGDSNKVVAMVVEVGDESIFTLSVPKICSNNEVDTRLCLHNSSYIALATSYIAVTKKHKLLVSRSAFGSDSSLDDCVSHLICPCCTLAQESRTLEINNVHDGTWHGRGDTMCIGTYVEVVFTFQPAMDAIDMVDQVICTLKYRSFTLKMKCWGDLCCSYKAPSPGLFMTSCALWKLATIAT
ncbi:PLAC8 family protein [Tanacetum coccineum]